MNFIKAIISNIPSSKLNKLIRSVVALCLMIVMLVIFSYSWLMSNYTSNIGSNDYVTISADAGLEMNYGEEDNNQGSINIENVKLTECSSVDGRNFFFPTSDFASIGDGSFSNGVKTNDLVFRESTANDINKKYISVNFTLSSESDTSVWLSNETKIAGGAAGAVRIAFIENKIGGKSTVFDNSTSSEYVEQNAAVKTVGIGGELKTTEACQTRSFNEFVFGNSAGNTLFDIAAGEDLNITMNIWLEGTDKDCTSSVLDLSDLQVFIKFSTSYEEVRTLYFIDHTLEKWVDDADCYVFAIDDSGVHHRMTKSATYDSDYTWSVSLPGSVEKVRFVRYNPDKEVDEKEWNYWEAGTLGSCSTYNAFGHSAGMWSESFSGTTITMFDGTPNGFLTNKGDDGLDIVMHVAFDIVDGNGDTQNIDYKMSYQYEYFRWQIVIPSSVSDVSFKRYDSTETTVYNSWDNTARGTNLYYTTTASGTGYWSSKLLYLDGYDENSSTDYKSGATFVAYFYENANDKAPVWTAMRAITPEKGRYIAAVPDGKLGVVFTRYNSSATDFGWGSNVYNQLDSSLEVFGTNNLFVMSGYNSSNYMNGTWYYSDNP